jgi:transposase-like protein
MIASKVQPNPTVRCPFCESTNTRKESDFGTTLAYAQFYCNECRTVFEWLKWEEAPDDQTLPGFLRRPGVGRAPE